MQQRSFSPFLSLILGAGMAFNAAPIFAQSVDTAAPAPPPQTTAEDEIVAYGTITAGRHKGLDAFFDGDFVTAEIEFEREFKGLKRFESARENAALDAELAADRAIDQSVAGNNQSSSVGGRGNAGNGGGASSSNLLSNTASVTSNFSSRRNEGGTVLTDGQVTYEDFGFTRYMSGLSEIKLGKYDEARKSLTQSLRYDESNFDARMRLGLLDVMDQDFEAAAKQLEKLDKQRRRCERLACDNLEEMNSATLTLAKQITSVVGAG